MSSITEERMQWLEYHHGHILGLRALITAYRAEVVARERAESEREELQKVITELVELYPALGRAIFSDDWDGEAGALEDIVQSARALLARLKDGGV